jgi:hypothetical protein
MDDSYFQAITAIADEAASKQAALSAGSSLVFHEKLLEGTKIKSLAPGAGVELSSTGDLVNVSVSPNLAVSSLASTGSTPISVTGGLQVSGLTKVGALEAAGVVTDQVVWVGNGNPTPSVMFPGSLALGKWRIRGNETGRFVLERFDDDGEVQTDGWLPVTTFTHDPNTNAAGLESAVVRVDALSPLSTAADAAVTCNGRLTVTGQIACGGVNVANGSVTIPNTLTVGGVSFASLNLTAIEPLRKVVNLQTGAVELRVDSPFWVCGVFDGVTLAKLSDSGRFPFTVTRPLGGVGVYRVAWTTAHPLGMNYAVFLTSETGIPFVRGRSDISSTGFNIAVRDANAYANSADRVVHVVVMP